MYRDEQASKIAAAKRERALSSNVIPGRDNRWRSQLLELLTRRSTKTARSLEESARHEGRHEGRGSKRVRKKDEFTERGEDERAHPTHPILAKFAC